MNSDDNGKYPDKNIVIKKDRTRIRNKKKRLRTISKTLNFMSRQLSAFAAALL